jgi:ribonucleotide monophosphatase NagD (HAD superfamily)
MNDVFRRLMDGVPLIAMHRNLYWKTAGGWELDAGAYIAGLEAAAATEAVVCGKPSAAYFGAALDVLGLPAERAAMVGDDIVNDVEGARAAGLTGILVRTGKYRAATCREARPTRSSIRWRTYRRCWISVARLRRRCPRCTRRSGSSSSRCSPWAGSGASAP